MKGNRADKIVRQGGISLEYPFRWEGLDEFTYPLDASGIPLVNMGGDLGLQFNPITVSQFGLFHLQQFAKTREHCHRQAAENCVSWLRDRFQPWRTEIGAWVYDYDLSFYGPKAPWISAMAQGQGISLILRSYQFFEDPGLLDITQQAFRTFLHPVSDGGVVARWPDGALVFEEFTTETPSLVLNGHMFALLGIHDYLTFWQDNSAASLFQEAVRGLKSNLANYDTDYWNLYDLHPTARLASPMYIKVHCQLLDILHRITAEAVFQAYAEKWRAYLASPYSRCRWLCGKIAEKVRLSF